MSMTDPIADYLTRIRNAVRARHRRVDIPSSNLKVKLSEILRQQGFINDFTVIEDDKQNVIRIALKYSGTQPAIQDLVRISKPGIRRYSAVADVPRVLNGLGIAIISTSKGLMTDKQARRENVGGEVLCYIY